MTAILKSIQKVLESKLNEARAALRQRDGMVIEQAADPLDTLQQAGEREMVMQTLNRNATLARQLRAALNRVQDGSFGICPDCDEEIAPKRLAAVPWAELCVACQDKADRSRPGGDEALSLAA